MSEAPSFQIDHLRKAYGSVAALVDANLSIAKGEVHALLGENGAGKSTLIRSAGGLTSPDGGVMRKDGRVYAPRSPADAVRLGVRVVSQEFSLAPNISILENLCLSSPRFLAEHGRGGRFPWRAARGYVRDALAVCGIALDPDEIVGRLPVSARQLVALVRGTLDDPTVMFLDEPTSALDQAGVEVLYKLVRAQRDAGRSIVYVSHKLEEIFDLADRVTIMRDGRSVLEGEAVEKASVDRLVATMVGRDISQLFPPRVARVERRTVFELRNLRARRVNDVSLHVKQGEILGLGGLVGAGRTELARAATGLSPITSGEVLLDGAPVRIRTRRDALRMGIEYATEDRLGEGLVVGRPIRENVSARVLGRFARGPFLNHADIDAFAEGRIREFGIAAPHAGVAVNTLSGGNQQKTLLAAVLASDPRVVFFDEPTRGIDVGAKAQIYATIRALSRDRAIILISAELIELLGLADRILMMRDGRIAGEFDPASASEQDLIAAAIGHQS